MLREVVVHILNEQPIVAELVSEPIPSDVALICRNLRTLNGKKPIFVDRADSTFVLPLAVVRFLEIHLESVEAHEVEMAAGPIRTISTATSSGASTNPDQTLRTAERPSRGAGPDPIAKRVRKPRERSGEWLMLDSRR